VFFATTLGTTICYITGTVRCTEYSAHGSCVSSHSLNFCEKFGIATLLCLMAVPKLLHNPCMKLLHFILVHAWRPLRSKRLYSKRSLILLWIEVCPGVLCYHSWHHDLLYHWHC